MGLQKRLDKNKTREKMKKRWLGTSYHVIAKGESVPADTNDSHSGEMSLREGGEIALVPVLV